MSLFSRGEAAALSPSQIYLCPCVTGSPRFVGALCSLTYRTLLFFPPSLAHSVSPTCCSFITHILTLQTPSSTRIYSVFPYFGNKSCRGEWTKEYGKILLTRLLTRRQSAKGGSGVCNALTDSSSNFKTKINRFVQYRFPPHWTILFTENTSGVWAWWWRWNGLVQPTNQNSAIHLKKKKKHNSMHFFPK